MKCSSVLHKLHDEPTTKMQFKLMELLAMMKHHLKTALILHKESCS